MAYIADGRTSLDRLNRQYGLLESSYGFEKEPVYSVNLGTASDPGDATVCAFRSRSKGPALWILAGIHGEEPAGPMAIAQQIHELGAWGQDSPMVIIPLLNPIGYARDWRYPDEPRDWRKGHSVGDSEHYLPDLGDDRQPRVESPRSDIAYRVTQFVLAATEDYPPVLIIDHHEDESLDRGYIYSQSKTPAGEEAGRLAVQILIAGGIPIQMDGRTRFDEPIQDGMVVGLNGKPFADGSIDELLAAERIIVAGRVVVKPGARTVLVIETPTVNLPLAGRVEAHAGILKHLRLLWELATR